MMPWKISYWLPLLLIIMTVFSASVARSSENSLIEKGYYPVAWRGILSHTSTITLPDHNVVVGWTTYPSGMASGRPVGHGGFFSVFTSKGELLQETTKICDDCSVTALVPASNGEFWSITEEHHAPSARNIKTSIARKYDAHSHLQKTLELGTDVIVFSHSNPKYSFGLIRGNGVHFEPYGPDDSRGQFTLELYPVNQDTLPTKIAFHLQPTVNGLAKPIALEDGRIILVWVSHGDREEQIYGSCLNPKDEHQSESFLIGGIGPRERNPQIIQMTGRKHVVTWLAPDSKYELSDIYGRYFEEACKPSGSAGVLSGARTNHYSASPLDQETLLLTFDSFNSAQEQWTIVATTVNRGGQPKPVVLNSGTQPNVVRLSENALFICWLEGGLGAENLIARKFVRPSSRKP